MTLAQTSLDRDKLERDILIAGKEIFTEMSAAPRRSVFDKQFYTEKFLAWGMQDESVKVSLFRFVDVLPALPNSAAIIRHVQEYFQALRGKVPALLLKGLDIRPGSLAAKLAAAAISKQVTGVAEQFIVGDTPQAALKKLRALREAGQAFTVDLLGEAAVGEEESRVYLDRYLDLLNVLATEVPLWPESAPIVKNHRGEETPLNISVKLSALYSQSRALNAERTRQVIEERFGKILSAALKAGAFVYLDMEDCSLTSLTIEIFKSLLMSAELRHYPRCGIVLQAYLRRTPDDLQELIEWTKKRGTPIAVRLVKGAYWDTESIIAKQQHWPIPVWEYKQTTDAKYEQLSLELLKNHQLIFPAFASHNVRSLLHAIKSAEQLGVATTNFEIQTLFGMGELIARAFAARGYLVRNYAPVGELIPGMGYLVRRLLENTSNEGFLRQSLHEQRDPELLLMRPEPVRGDTGKKHLQVNVRTRFYNSALRDFSVEAERESIHKALREQMSGAKVRVQPVINGKKISSAARLTVTSPENPDLILAEVELATAENAKQSVESLANYFSNWRDTTVESRAEILYRTAEILEERRPELTATIILESGKSWAESDADVAEAIDFLNFYAHEAIKLFRVRHPGSHAGETNSYFYEPRGVTLVISPWNFPLAIPCGMFAAALVSGNCAILKPAEQTSLIAYKLFQAFLEAGLPPQAAAFLPGIGEELGPVLNLHPQVVTTVFTGSRDVGLLLLSQGAESSSGAGHVKRVIAEMGGKNAIIVDDDADYDEAIKGILHSAFGYQGQKCSACSRAIVVGDNYENFAARLAAAAASIPIGPASDPASIVAPVIDRTAFERIGKAISAAKKDCKLLIEGGTETRPLDPRATYIRPTIFADVPRSHPLWRQELFGPVLALVRAADFAAALELANDSEYGLTGAVFSRSPKNIDTAVKEFRVGNLYINRGCTGALVMRQPFGGAKMSGVGSKAGGPDYLLQFVIPRALTENTLRRGFAPGVEEGVGE